MKTILSSRRHHYVARVSTFLIAIALIVGTIGCEAGGEEVGPLDHFKWYLADGVEPIGEVVYLKDQFCAVNATVGWAAGFGNPAKKVHGEETTPISSPDHHLAAYYLDYEAEPQEWFVKVENQFGIQELTVWGPIALLLPTQKEGHQSPVNLDHYLLYEVTEGEPVEEVVSLQDQFDDEPQESFVDWPMYFANPVQKTHGSEVTEILDPEAHLVFYAINASFSGEVEVVNQFGEQTIDVYTLFGFGGLAVPSEKIDYWQESVYDLNMAANPGEGGTATDLTGASPYTAGAGVNIKAVANPGYSFVSWTAPAGGFTNANAAQTTFTMPAQDVTVTANFEPSEFYGGSGTVGDPYQIANWHYLHNVRNYLDSYFILVNNLDFTTAGYTELASPTANGGKGWQPIGSIEDDEPVDPFTGTFDGQGYEIRDLFIDRPDEDGVGLFGAVDVGGVIQNVGVVDADVTGFWWVGGLVGWNYDGTVDNCHATGSVDGGEGGWGVGGLLGCNEGDVSNSYAEGNVIGDNYVGVGGLVGWNYYGAVDHCHAIGSVDGTEASWDVGGLVGWNVGDVSNSYATGAVTSGTGSNGTGGLVGGSGSIMEGIVSYGTVSNCSATGTVTGGTGSLWTGGLVGGCLDTTVSDSYATGDVTGSEFVGGLAGAAGNSIVSNCHYATGTVTGDHAVGGLVGVIDGGTVDDSYSTGNVIGSSGGRSFGGLVGGIDASVSTTVSNCYATGTVTGGNWTGGLVGAMGGTGGATVSDSYSTGSVTGADLVGGLVGLNGGGGTVSDSYSTGSVTGDSNVGGLVGANFNTVSNSFWDTQTSGQGSSAGGTPKTTAQMKDFTTFSVAGWDIFAVANSSTRNTGYVWNIVDDATYPFLSWQPV